MCFLRYVYGKLSFWAISDKSQIFQLAHSLREGNKIIAIVAPAYISQFGEDVTPRKFKTALEILGFSDVYRVALEEQISELFPRRTTMQRKLLPETFRFF